MTEVETEAVEMKKKNKPVDPGAIGIRLGEDLREDIEQLAEAEGKTMGSLCVELIEKGVKNTPERRRALLLKSLAITKQQVNRFVEAAEADPDRSWLSRRKGVTEAEEVVKRIERLERELKD